MYHADYRKLKNQYRFISEIIENKLIVSKKKKPILVQELRDRKYEAFPPKSDEKKSRADEDQEANDEDQEEEEVAQGARDYDYLLSVSFFSVCPFLLPSLTLNRCPSGR